MSGQAVTVPSGPMAPFCGFSYVTFSNASTKQRPGSSIPACGNVLKRIVVVWYSGIRHWYLPTSMAWRWLVQ